MGRASHGGQFQIPEEVNELTVKYFDYVMMRLLRLPIAAVESNEGSIKNNGIPHSIRLPTSLSSVCIAVELPT
jgi:hypothetical protein